MNKKEEADDPVSRWAKEDLSRFGRRIAEQRRARGWKQRELSRRTGIPPTRLSRVENGDVRPRIEELVALRHALAVGLDELVFGRPPATYGGRLESLARTFEEVGAPPAIDVVERLLRCLIQGDPAAAAESLRIVL